MKARYQQLELHTNPIRLSFTLHNPSNTAWTTGTGYHLGSQIYDPATDTFITEGQWSAIDIQPGATQQLSLDLALPPQDGPYRIYISPLHDKTGWFFHQGSELIIIDTTIANGHPTATTAHITTLTRLRRGALLRATPKAFTLPLKSIAANRRLIASMVRRDILARYRGSFGDMFWTILNPLLLMSTYFFVFGIVLDTRFGPDHSRTGFALYFFAGFLPWLAMSEALGRAPGLVLEYRNLVKKLVYPVETLPVNHVLSGFVTELFALALFFAVLAFLHGIPPTALWLPAVIIPQVLFTLGLCWLLAATGAYIRDLAQVIGFLLTLWFFITPICYLDARLFAAAPLLRKNPLFVIVDGYRRVLLDGQPPNWSSLWKLWLLAAICFIAGHAWFHKLRRSFADVI